MSNMDSRYKIEDTSEIFSPGLVVFREVLESNIDKMIELAGGPQRLRPHCKTHKMREVTAMLLERGIVKHKCATFAEAEMLVEVGVNDIFLAYSLVGPNIARAVAFGEKYPDVLFSVTADHQKPIAELGRAMTEAGQTIEVLLDLDSGQHRTGLPVGQQACRLYQQIADCQGLVPGGLHLYDGQNHQTAVAERTAAVDECWQATTQFRDQLVEAGCAVPRIVAGGSGSFPIYAAKDDPALELSPGTVIFFDVGYGKMFPDLEFTPAALILTRVISRPTEDRLTVDLGYKACASDPPVGQRLFFPDLPDAEQVLQNEEHLVLQTPRASQFEPGDELLAIPRHICPTSALHKQASIISGGKLSDRWDVAARDRWLTI